MNQSDPNIEMLDLVARALGDMTQRLVFVGGCATGMLITDTGRSPVRATKDVDAIASVGSISGYYEIERDLRSLGFKQTQSDEPICRWTFGELKLDVMPSDEKILGFSNRWYSDAIRTAISRILPSGQKIFIVTPPYFLATKIEAFHGRGNQDYLMSHDIEDIITIVDGRKELLEEVASSDQELQNYIAYEIEGFLGETAFSDAVPCHLPPDQSNQERAPIILERLRILAKL